MIQNLQVVDPLTGEFNLTNVFQFTFKLSSLDPLPQIIPRTYHEVSTYLLYFFSCNLCLIDGINGRTYLCIPTRGVRRFVLFTATLCRCSSVQIPHFHLSIFFR
jgi:hypothetical protein